MNDKFTNIPEDDQQADGIIEGRNCVNEAISLGKTIDKLFYAKGERDGAFGALLGKARDRGIICVECDRRKLDFMSKTGNHQGVVAVCSVREYSTVDDILKNAADSDRPALIIICDQITDPHNLGAIIRSADAAGAHGVIIPKRRSAGLTSVVSKASAGAAEYLPVARVSNINMTISELKENGIWVYAACAGAESSIYKTDLTGPMAIVIGSEGDGISPLVEKNCDFLVNIPMVGKINSLNASVATAVILFEALRQRG